MATIRVHSATGLRLLGWAFLSLATLSLAACTPSTKMTGVVKDNFGSLVEGVAVTVDNTGYTATTDKTGRYTLPYDPGAVNIRFTKDGYAIGHFGIRLPKQSKAVPIDVVVLEKFPPGDGVW